jgi:hypothetical protein
MGSPSYSDEVYSARLADCRATGKSMFTHDADIRAGRAESKVHEKLDPAGVNKAGKIIRESLDSPNHPTSRAVAILFDVTGSMHRVPSQFKDKLNTLMALLVKKGYIEHPHVMFGAIGDATVDDVPLQIGQFEGGNEMDEALSKIVLEGGGGRHQTESYELAMYFMSRHAVMDCFNKRGQKGYLFISGDELPYPAVKASEVKRIIGDTIQSDIPTEKILEELRDKFEVFWVMPEQGSYSDDSSVMDPLRKMFGQNLLLLKDANDICELIAATVGVAEGYDIHDVSKALKDIGADSVSVEHATSALTKYAASAVTKAASLTGKLVPASKSDSVERL